jgi:hypothetical protein
MKKCGILLILIVLFTGCHREEPMETVSDELLVPVLSPTYEIVVSIPEEATEAVISSQDDQRLYFCNGYTMEIQTLAGGDLEKTVKMISGYQAQDLTIVKTRTKGVKKAQWVWSSVGESGDQLGRAVVLDDGRYHYCVSVMSDASVSGQLEQEWETVFASVTLTNQGS